MGDWGRQAWPEPPLPPLWPAGEIIQVRETVTPGTLLYTLLLPGQGAQVRPACGQWWGGRMEGDGKTKASPCLAKNSLQKDSSL